MEKKNQTDQEIRVRIAPSPTGVPHIGVTRTALFNFLFAKHHHGKFIVRLEDTDRTRYLAESEEKIFQILTILGLKADEGPKEGGPYSPYIQSKRLDLYQKYADELLTKNWAYWCFCSPDRLEEMRKNQQKAGQLPKYDRYCLNLPQSEIEKKLKKEKNKVIRFKIPDSGQTSWNDLIHGKVAFQNQLLDDRVLLKSDGFPTYHLAVVVDDHLMEISHVLRGDEWISSTPIHLLLYQAFGWQRPEFGHLPIILGPDKAKLSKRHGAKSVIEYSDEGYLPEALINFMVLLGWNPKTNEEIFTLDQLIKIFDIKGINPTSPIFNLEKLQWFNREWIKRVSDRELGKKLENFVPKDWDRQTIEKLVPLAKERMTTLADFSSLVDYIFTSKTVISLTKKEKEFLANYILVLEKISDWKGEKLRKASEDFVQKTKKTKKEIFMLVRRAISGKDVTLPLFESMEILGKEETLKRIESAVKQ